MHAAEYCYRTTKKTLLPMATISYTFHSNIPYSLCISLAISLSYHPSPSRFLPVQFAVKEARIRSLCKEHYHTAVRQPTSFKKLFFQGSGKVVLDSKHSFTATKRWMKLPKKRIECFLAAARSLGTAYQKTVEKLAQKTP